MIEAWEFIPSVLRTEGTLAAGELARKMLLEVEHEAGQRPPGEGGSGEAEKQPQALERRARPKEPTPLEAAAEITGQHRRLWDKVSRKLVIGLKKTDPKEGLERLKVLKLAGDILSVVVRGQRQAWGLEALEGEIGPGDTQEIIEEMASLTAPSRADTSVE